MLILFSTNLLCFHVKLRAKIGFSLSAFPRRFVLMSHCFPWSHFLEARMSDYSKKVLAASKSQLDGGFLRSDDIQHNGKSNRKSLSSSTQRSATPHASDDDEDYGFSTIPSNVKERKASPETTKHSLTNVSSRAYPATQVDKGLADLQRNRVVASATSSELPTIALHQSSTIFSRVSPPLSVVSRHARIVSPRLKALDHSQKGSPLSFRLPSPQVSPSNAQSFASRLPEEHATEEPLRDGGDSDSSPRVCHDKALASIQKQFVCRNVSGFVNAGNTCYAGSVLTMLLRLKIVRESLSGFVATYGNLVKSVRRRRSDWLGSDDATLRRGLFDDDDNSAANACAEDKVVDQKTSAVCQSTLNDDEEQIFICPLHLALHTAAVALESPSEIRGGLSVSEIADALTAHDAGADFFDGDQHDAHEFFVALVSVLEFEALAAMTKKHKRECRRQRNLRKHLQEEQQVNDVRPPTARDTWVNKLFQGSMHSVIGCRRKSCGLVQSTQELFVNVSVSIPPMSADTNVSTRDTQTLIEQSLAADALDSYKCDRCHHTNLQFQAGSFDLAPPLLVVHWKRFSHSFVDGTVNFRKNTEPVFLSESFSVGSNAASHPNQKGLCKTHTTYTLQSFVGHRGSMLGGHYVAAFRGPPLDASGGEHAWFIANDSVVAQISKNQTGIVNAKNESCYLAVYEATSCTSETAVCDIGGWEASLLPPLSADDDGDHTEQVCSKGDLE